MQQMTIRDVSEYISGVTRINESDSVDTFDRPKELLFRGQSDEGYQIIPSLGRYKKGKEDLCMVERNMIETAKLKMPNVFTKDLEPIELLTLLQHYGVPTRLLDITENALVALYFACASDEKKNGEVFVFKNHVDDVVNYPVINAIADSYRFSRESFRPLHLFFSNVIQQPYFLEQKDAIQRIYKDDKEGGEWIAQCCETPLFVRASIRLARQQIQRGRYILFPNEISVSAEGKYFRSRIKPMEKDHVCILGRILIPADRKKAVLEEMKALGIDRGILFADSVDITCEEIKKEFFDRKR